MVFLSALRLVTKSGYDKTLKRQKILKLTAKYFGRRRNCYSIAMKFLNKALKYTTVSRKVKPDYVDQLRRTRISAACEELGADSSHFSHNLIKCNINLGNGILQDLAIWEPRTFKCLTEIAQVKSKIEAPKEVSERLTAPTNVITRGML